MLANLELEQMHQVRVAYYRIIDKDDACTDIPPDILLTLCLYLQSMIDALLGDADFCKEYCENPDEDRERLNGYIAKAKQACQAQMN